MCDGHPFRSGKSLFRALPDRAGAAVFCGQDFLRFRRRGCFGRSDGRFGDFMYGFRMPCSYTGGCVRFWRRFRATLPPFCDCGPETFFFALSFGGCSAFPLSCSLFLVSLFVRGIIRRSADEWSSCFAFLLLLPLFSFASFYSLSLSIFSYLYIYPLSINRYLSLSVYLYFICHSLICLPVIVLWILCSFSIRCSS